MLDCFEKHEDLGVNTNYAKNLPLIYFCKFCDFKCFKKNDWTRHIMTPKHMKNDAKDYTKLHQKDNKNLYKCVCGKEYKHRQGLWKHKQTCNFKVEENEENEEKQIIKKLNEIKNDNEITQLTNLVLEMVKQNSELQKSMMKVLENGTHNTTNNNSHNKTFNLQLFLNETCKDAMNIMDFVDSIKLQLSDLEKVGELGFVEGISSIIVNNLKKLDVTE